MRHLELRGNLCVRINWTVGRTSSLTVEVARALNVHSVMDILPFFNLEIYWKACVSYNK